MVHEAVVIDRREPYPGIIVIGCRAPELARFSRPGQFVMVIPPSGERVATALGIYEATDDRVSVMLVVVGPRTRELALLGTGDSVVILGPLGHGFQLRALGHNVALVAGGVGIASLLLLAQRLVASGVRTKLYYGARTAGALVDAELFAGLGCDVSLATDDGSRGTRGFVTDVLAREGAGHSGIAACGPSPMLRATGAVAARLDVKAQLSLEETFACGVGACWGCVVPIARDGARAPAFPPVVAGESREYVHARICKEGPVFWAHELRW
jgi:dihydroorotate dehydrogenase electron transfer subunit